MLQAFFMEEYIKIAIETSSTEETEILIAKLSEISFYAFEEENNLLNAYVKQEDFDEEKLESLLSSATVYTRHIIQEENWNQQWESGLVPVVVNNFAGIRPSFQKPIENVKHELIITPKMSFGTGHHATTFLMIELMEELDFTEKTVIDFGTGTGVLAILAEKCDASKITAVDYDEWSINNVRENVEANLCKKITIKQQNDLSGIGQVDILLANINLNVLKNESFSISSLLKRDGFLLVSGFLYGDEEEMREVFEENKFVKLQNKQRGDWLSILFKKC